MKAPAQILAALAAASALAFLPLTTRFQEAGLLHENAAKRSAVSAVSASGSTPAGKTAATDASQKADAAGRERIPAGLTAAEASRVIADLKALDGKMLPSRRIVELLEAVMLLPESSMEEARAVIEQSKNMVLTGFLASALYSRWGELNPDAARTALEGASKSGNPVFKFAGAAALAGGWMEKDPDAFIKWVTDKKEGEDQAGKEMRDMMMNSALVGMANLDAATAEKLIAAAPQDRRSDMIMNLAMQDPNADPRDAAARALAEAGDNKGQRGSVHWRLARELAEKDPQEAFKYAETLKPDERGTYYEAGFSSMLKKDKDGALKWIAGQPEDVQTSSIRGMRGRFDDMSYEETVKFADGVSRKAGDEVWASALSEKARKDPQAALTYLPNVAEDRRQFSYSEVATSWTKKDPQATSEWVDSIEPGKQKDYAIQGMVGELRSKEPDSSTIWAASVSDDAMRERLVQENAKVWLKRDRPAAEEWINGAENISEELKTKLLDPK